MAAYLTWPLPNVHIGVSVEDQRTADERIPLLLQTPAAVRWVSYEPALGAVDFERIQWPGRHRVDVLRGGSWELNFPRPGDFVNHSDLGTISWVVVGGESGPGARPCDVEWIRSVVRQCKDAAVPVFVKQLGAWPRFHDVYDIPEHIYRAHDCHGTWDNVTSAVESVAGAVVGLDNRKGSDPAEWPADLRVRELPEAQR